MSAAETWLHDAPGLADLVARMARGIAAGRRPGLPLRLVGVRKRGVPIAERLAEALRAATGEEVPVGAVDITLYRDDLERRRTWPVLRGTHIPFPVDGAEIVLVDDVLHTGRTIRAALNAVCDHGRPDVVRLAAVVDRGGRELPFRPDVVGTEIAAGPGEDIQVRLAPGDGREGIVRVSGQPGGAAGERGGP